MANTLGIANALKTLIMSAQIQGQPALSNGQVGKYKDLIGMTPCCEVVVDTDSTERETMNTPGSPVDINDTQDYETAIIVDPTNDNAAWQLLMNIRDAVTALIHAESTLGIVGVDGVWLLGNGKYQYLFQNGRYFLSWRINVRVRYDYTVILSAN